MLHFWSLLNHLRWSMVRMRRKSKAVRTLQMAWPQTNFHLHLSNRHVAKKPSLLLGHWAVFKSEAQARNQLNNVLIRGNILPGLTKAYLGFRSPAKVWNAVVMSASSTAEERSYLTRGIMCSAGGCASISVLAHANTCRLHLHPHQNTTTQFLLHLLTRTQREPHFWKLHVATEEILFFFSPSAQL